MTDISALALLFAGLPEASEYSTAIRRHMEIVKDLIAKPPSGKFRGEMKHETRRRQYWQQQIGRRWKPWDFICVYPMLSKRADFCFTTRSDTIREYFSASAKTKQVANRKKYHSRGAPGTKYLKVKDMVRVQIIGVGHLDGRSGFVTALHPTKGYRVTIWPDERWKDKTRRWLNADAFKVTGERKLPELPT